MRRFVLAAVAIAVVAGASSAQTVIQRRVVPDDVTRVTVNSAFSESNVPAGAEEQQALGERLRKAF